MKVSIRREGLFLAAAAVVTLALAAWLAPVTYDGRGSVAVASDSGATETNYSADCSDAVWPNIPAECLKNADEDGRKTSRVIAIGDAGQRSARAYEVPR